MSEQTLYCEECLEDIPASEIFWEDDRLYCKLCGSELEPEDRDLWEQIDGNLEDLRFSDDEEDEEKEEAAEEKEEEEEAAKPGEAEEAPGPIPERD